MRKIFYFLTLLIFFSSNNAYADSYIKSYLPNGEKVGEGRLTVLFWDVYDATLYAPNGQWQENKPLALKLSYLRNISGKKIADSSVEEIRKQGFSDEVKLADWHTQMRTIFPDVDEGTTLTGILTRDGQTLFYQNGQAIGHIKDPEFGRYFFDIWLSEKTTAPQLRRKLLRMQ